MRKTLPEPGVGSVRSFDTAFNAKCTLRITVTKRSLLVSAACVYASAALDVRIVAAEFAVASNKRRAFVALRGIVAATTIRENTAFYQVLFPQVVYLRNAMLLKWRPKTSVGIMCFSLKTKPREEKYSCLHTHMYYLFSYPQARAYSVFS